VAAVAHGAEAVGLLRSELLFLDRDTAPEEREQAEVYRAVAAALGRGRRLVIRTLDVGGDKPLAYLPLPAEQNPFLGLRGIRVSLERPDLLRSQLRAILAAAALSDVHVMFPMIATLDELRAARRILAEERAGGASVRVGVMIEVPSADRKSTRLNSSHSQISYAVFCLKKKKTTKYENTRNSRWCRACLTRCTRCTAPRSCTGARSRSSCPSLLRSSRGTRSSCCSPRAR